MDTIERITAAALSNVGSDKIRRLVYAPYKMDFSLAVVERIGKTINPRFLFTPETKRMYEKLIMYFHADSRFDGDLSKGIMIMGATGAGKTLAMKIMRVYREVDDIKFIKNNQAYRMNFEVCNVNDIVNGFINNSYDGIQVYCNRYVTCLDDLGTETETVKHYGNSLDVIGYVISERSNKGLLTFATSNFPNSVLKEKYGDRMESRMNEMFNFITLGGQDFRKLK